MEQVFVTFMNESGDAEISEWTATPMLPSIGDHVDLPKAGDGRTLRRFRVVGRSFRQDERGQTYATLRLKASR